MFNKYIKTQHICISIEELFQWQDRLEQLNKEEAYDLFNEFLEEAESTLDLNPELEKELSEACNDKCIPVTSINDLFDEDMEFEKRTREAYNRTVNNPERKTYTKKEFLEELDKWTTRKDYTEPPTYNPYNWTYKKIKQ